MTLQRGSWYLIVFTIPLMLWGCAGTPGGLPRAWFDSIDAVDAAERQLRTVGTDRSARYQALLRAAEAKKVYIEETGMAWPGLHPDIPERFDEAVSHYDEAIRLFPDSTRARQGRRDLIAFAEERAPIWAVEGVGPRAPTGPTFDDITAAVLAVTEPMEAEYERRAAEQEAENRRLLAEATEEARRREEEQRRREEEQRRRQEAANRRPNQAPPPSGSGVVIGPTPEERRQAEEERRRREEASRTPSWVDPTSPHPPCRGEGLETLPGYTVRMECEEARQRAAEEERRRQEEASRLPEWVDPTSPHPPCRGQGLDTFTEASVRTRCEMFLRNHALVEGFRRNARAITITVHSTCEVDHSSLEDGDVASVYVMLKLEGAITGTSRLTGAWFGTGLPSFDSGAGAISLPTSRGDSQAENWLSPRWQQYRITFDARRHGSGPPLTFDWSRNRRGPGLAETGIGTTTVVDGGVYDYQGRSTGSLPSCFR